MLKRIINHAIEEWDLFLPKGNPVEKVSLPAKGKPRSRRLQGNEEKRLYQYSKKYGGEIQYLIPLAIETAARRSELQKLKWANINFNQSTAMLLDTKNSEDREIPLTLSARTILSQIPKVNAHKVFSMVTSPPRIEPLEE